MTLSRSALQHHFILLLLTLLIVESNEDVPCSQQSLLLNCFHNSQCKPLLTVLNINKESECSDVVRYNGTMQVPNCSPQCREKYANATATPQGKILLEKCNCNRSINCIKTRENLRAFCNESKLDEIVDGTGSAGTISTSVTTKPPRTNSIITISPSSKTMPMELSLWIASTSVFSFASL